MLDNSRGRLYLKAENVGIFATYNLYIHQMI